MARNREVAKVKDRRAGPAKEIRRVARKRVGKGELSLHEKPFEWYMEKFPKQFRDLNTVDEFFTEIEGLMRRSAVSWIKIGIYLEHARNKLGRNSFYELCESLGLNPKATAWRYRKMAKHPWLSDPKNWDHLPANQAALLMIAKHEQELTPKVLDELVQAEELHPATEPKDIRGWLTPPDGMEKEKEDRYKPIAKSVALRLGLPTKDVSEKDWKEFDKLVKQAYRQWLQKLGVK